MLANFKKEIEITQLMPHNLVVYHIKMYKIKAPTPNNIKNTATSSNLLGLQRVRNYEPHSCKKEIIRLD